MPVEFLTDEQAAAYGRYAGPVPRADLDRYFFPDDADRALIESKRREANRLGYAVQLCTARYLGTFLTDLSQVPEEAVVYLAEQLDVADPACLSEYAAREKTRLEHAWEIRREYGFAEFSEHRPDLEEWLRAQVWTTTDGPKALFDGASAWLRGRGVLLPGATVLARLVSQVRDEVTGQLWQALCELITPAQRANLETLLVVVEGKRSSLLDQLRKGPTRRSGQEMVRALDRVSEVFGLGLGQVDLSAFPARRITEMARYGLSGKATSLRFLRTVARDASPRDRAICHLAYYAGLRVAEIVADIRLSARKGSVRVRGKGWLGGKDRTVPLHSQVRTTLEALLYGLDRPAAGPLIRNREGRALSTRSANVVVCSLPTDTDKVHTLEALTTDR